MVALLDIQSWYLGSKSLPGGNRGRLIVGWLVLAFTLIGCDMNEESASTFPPDPPLTAVLLEGDGPYEVRMDRVIISLRQALEPLVGDLQFSHFRLPSGSQWKTVHNHYSQALSGDWVAIEDIAVQGRAYQAKAWRNNDQALVVAFIENPTPSPSPFSILLVAIAGNP